MENKETDENVRDFDIDIIISVISGRVFTEIENMYDILDYLTGDNIFTHQIPRVAEQVRPYILSIYPQLERMGTDVVVTCEEEAIAYINEQKKKYGNSLKLSPMSINEGYSYIDPLEELAIILSKKK